MFPDGEKFTKKILCRWHVYRSWKKRAKEDIVINFTFFLFSLIQKDQYLLQQTLMKLNRLLKLAYATDFEENFNELLTHITEKVPKFADYIRKYYFGSFMQVPISYSRLDKKEQWSTVDRIGSVFQTSMFAESWHAKLKVELLNRKTNARVDFLIYILTNMENAMITDAEVTVSVFTTTTYEFCKKIRKSYLYILGNPRISKSFKKTPGVA